MIDLEDRVLEHALERHFARVEDPDLAPSVRGAWERGERGVDLAELELELALEREATVRRPRALPAPRRARLPRVLVAAGLAAALFGAWRWIGRSDPDPGGRAPPLSGDVDGGRPADGAPQVAESSRPLPLWRTGREVVSPHVRASDDVWVDPSGPATLSTGGGTRVEASPGTLLAFAVEGERDVVRLLAGAARVEGGSRALEVRTSFGQFELRAEDGRAAIALELDFERPGKGLAPPDLAALVAAARALEPSTQARGSATLLAGTATSTDTPADTTAGALARGETRAWITRPGAGFVAAPDVAPLHAHLDAFADAGGWPMPLMPPGPTEPVYVAARRAEAELSRALAAEPSAWLLVEPALAKRFDAAKRAAGLPSHALAVLVADRSPAALRIVRERWLARPDLFDERSIVALAERGVPELEREALARAASCDEPDGLPGVVCAAWALERGDAAARACLLRFVAGVDLADKRGDLALFAAAALERAGEAGAWRAVVERLAAVVEQRLARDERMLAARSALVAEYFDARRAAGFAAATAFDGLDEHLERRGAEVQGAGEVRAVLAALRL